MNRQGRTAGHPPAHLSIPLYSGYNENATPNKNVPGFGGDTRVVKAGNTMVDQERAHTLRRMGKVAP